MFMNHKNLPLFVSSRAYQGFLPVLAGGEKLGAFAVHEEACGAAAGAIETKAELSGDFYKVNGTKIFISNAQEAEVYLVLVRTDPSRGPPRHFPVDIREGNTRIQLW